MAYSPFGFHAGAGGNRRGIGDYFKKLDAAGRPAIIKSADDYGVCRELAALRQRSSVPHVIVFRKSGGPFELPDYTVPATQAARDHWALVTANLPPEFHRDGDKEHVWLEIINEPDKNRADWLGWFMVEAGRLAVDQGYKLAGPGWSSGEPEPDHWRTPGWQEYLRLCARHPDHLGVALHEYSLEVSTVMAGGGFLIGRFRQLFQAADELGVARPTTIMTEFGWAATDVPPPDRALADLRKVANLYRPHPQIIGAAIWYLGAGYEGIADKTQRLIAPVTEYALSNEWRGERDPLPEPPPGGGATAAAPDAAEATGFHSSVDLDRVPAGASFQATWSFRNSGATAWNDDYRLTYTEQPHPETTANPRSPFGATTAYSLRKLGASKPVRPGETVSLTVPLEAPKTAATHATNWRLQSPGGQFFGPTRWLRAVVVPQAQPPVRTEGGAERTDVSLSFGIHDEAGADWMRQQGMRGWGLHTVALGPNETRLDLRRFADAGIKMLVRLNYGYHPQGNLPLPGMADYERFIEAAVRTMHNSVGAWGWIIGNETNNASEWPGGPDGKPISAGAYATLYNRIFGRRPGGARVGPQAIDPYNARSGDCRIYWQQILQQIDGADFLTLHPKTQDSNPHSVDSAQEFTHAPLLGQFYHLRAYQPLMDRVPARFRHLPVIATEVNPQRHNDGKTLGWQEDQGAAWVERTVAHFRNYNRRAEQPVTAVIFYRFDFDEWKLRDKPSILTAIREAARG